MSRAVESVPSVPATDGAAPQPLPGWRSTLPGGLLRTARPKQWVKNVLVFAAPGAAGVLSHGHALIDAVATFLLFTLVASGVYFLNDVADVESDRQHPRKRLRPVAAGVVSTRLAVVLGASFIAAGLGLAVLVNWKLVLVLAIYVGVQFSYAMWLKHEPILDLAAVASGFVLRAIAGGVAVGVPISEWFLIVATFGSLFMVTGKRAAEHVTLGDARGSVRATLDAYSLTYLRSILVVSATVTITAYCLWAFENARAVLHSHTGIWFQLSIVPFTLAMLRYGLLIDQGHGGQPEDVVLGDRVLQVLGLLWALLFALGVYG
jgi:decaprenyl-phosphate phosphoribosyltransferase